MYLASVEAPFSFGREIQVSSLPRQKGVTEFQPERRSLSLTLTDQSWTNNPNVTPSSYPIKIWHLFDMVAPIAHIIQQNFLIGLFAKSDTFHWSRCFH